MKPFSSVSEMIETHERMFGQAGRTCAELVCRHVKLFDEPLNPLKIRVTLAPVEIAPYDKHIGYTNHPRDLANAFYFILANRRICGFDETGAFVLDGNRNTEDFLVHELTHHRQQILLARSGARQSRGVHRDSGWYGAIKEAAPRYLGLQFPESIWPKMISKRNGKTVSKTQDPARLTEVELNYWPQSFRKLMAAKDPRLAGL